MDSDAERLAVRFSPLWGKLVHLPTRLCVGQDKLGMLGLKESAAAAKQLWAEVNKVWTLGKRDDGNSPNTHTCNV